MGAVKKNAGATTTAPNMLAYVAAVPDEANAATDAATWVQATVGAAGVWPLPIGPAQFRRSYVLGDWINVQSLPRTDGGEFALLAVRSWVNGGTLTLWGDAAGNDHSTNWATRPNGKIWRRRRLPGNHANTGDFNASAAACDESPLLGVQYAARGRVITVAFVGDSIMEGRGTYLGEGYALPAVEGLASDSVAFEAVQLGWSGAGSATFLTGLNDLIAAGLVPDAVVYASGTPNDVATTITDAQVSAMRFRFAQAAAACKSNRVQLIAVPWLPSNFAAKPYGSSDSKRRAYSDDVEARSSSGVLSVLASSVFGGALGGNGQQTIAAGLSGDNVHPNDAGNSALYPQLQVPLRRLAA